MDLTLNKPPRDGLYSALSIVENAKARPVNTSLEVSNDRLSAKNIVSAARLEALQSIHSSLPSKSFGVPSIKKSLGQPKISQIKQAYAVGE